jgi:NADH-quinone oxidoreductase subunit F
VELRAPGGECPKPNYLVVNADEMEPGTFNDRLLLEGDPHQPIAGVILSACAIGASIAYIFLRGEYRTAARILRHAMAEARRPDCSGTPSGIRDSPWTCTCT